MSLMDMFSRKKTAAESEVAAEPTAVDYVEWLLQYMLGTSRMTLTIDTTQGLPGSAPMPNGLAPPPCLPEAVVVLNRLKILSGVNPIKQNKPVDGKFERPRKHLSVLVATRFQDDDNKSTCTIRLTVKGLTA